MTMSDTAAIAYHLAPASWYAAGDPAAPYLPEAFAADGFIHCTDGRENVVATANRHEDPARVRAEYHDLVATLDRPRNRGG
jgi:uncharacterized protein (DUF952 family)